MHTYQNPCSYNLDGGDSGAKSAKCRRSRLSIMGLGDDPFNMDQRSHNALESQLSDVTLSLREEPESHPSMQPHQSQLPMSQVSMSQCLKSVSLRCSARASSRLEAHLFSRAHSLTHVRPHAMQRITPYQQTIAQKAAAYFAKNDGDDAKLRFFEMANPNFKTTHTAAKMFYALLGMTRSVVRVVLRSKHLAHTRVADMQV